MAASPGLRKCSFQTSSEHDSRFESAHPLEPEARGHVQWPAALGAGFIAGAILLIVPRGSPWSSVTFFSPVIIVIGLVAAGAYSGLLKRKAMPTVPAP